MAFYVDEDEIWKCRRHPSKHRRSGVCPICLRDRLITLCPDCRNSRPCACCPISSSSYSSSSFSLLSSTDAPKSGSGVGSVGRISNLIDKEPAFRRSRSAAFPFLRPNPVDKDAGVRQPPLGNQSKSSIWSVFKSSKMKKEEEAEVVKKMVRSKSVGIPCRDSGGDVRLKGRSWYFPSPMKVFRQTKMAKIAEALICSEDWLRSSFDDDYMLSLYDDVLDPESEEDKESSS
ncbi:hypothetical protein HHK36_028191 [Tetracentron sinense]|uniref:Uncharacterized protein n=1 Tax=Tetracentron sinense TaxID=13715 RepID=A0A834YJI0_TETSI|nr:hypothetical protein HHK36_028191 [Tetracentron sinense]